MGNLHEFVVKNIIKKEMPAYFDCAQHRLRRA